MKSILHYFFSILVCLMMLAFSRLNAQNKNTSSWAKKFEYQKVFIENKGQFTIPSSFGNPGEIAYAVDHGGTKIFFTKKGITYTFLEPSKKQKDQREIERERREEFKDPEEFARHEKEEHQLKVKSDQVTMLWQNANDDAEIIASDMTADYHSYHFKDASTQYKNIRYARGFKKITYKNIYPNIDIDYVFAEKGGLEYSLTLHPGADPSQIKMVYDSHVELNNTGEIRISTKFGDIIDHAPLSFYQNNNNLVIASNFSKTGKIVSFQLENYDNTKTVIIDPWTQTPAFASNWDCVWECEKDGAGNVYIIGGVTPMQLLKYNAAGALQWTYNTPYDTTAWLGTFAVDNVGNSYVTQGSGAQIVKVSTAGAVVWNNTSPGGISLSTEFWCITFNCDQTRLIIGGTGGAGFSVTPYIYEMNMASGNVVSSQQVAGGGGLGKEVRSIAPCGNGRYYFLSHDTIGYINQNFTACSSPNAALYKISSGYNLSYKCENYRYDNSGIMAIKANTSFVYVNRGNQIDKRDLNTSAIISSAAIPGGGYSISGFGNSVQNSGIDIDNCGNVYVGSKNSVIKFDANLNQLASYATTYNVYDVHVNTGGNIIACGSTGTSATGSRTGTIEYINASACTTISLTCCDANICQVPNMCSTAAPVNLQAATAGGSWSGTGITNASTGTFNPATAGVGTHVITYSLACGVGTTTIVVSPCATLSVCLQPNGSVTVSNGVGPYTWATFIPGTSSPITNQTQCQACGYTWVGFPLNQCVNGATPVTTCSTAASWSNFATGTNTTLPGGATQIKITDAAGTTITFTPGTIPPCTTTACPTLTMAITSQTNVNCFGSSTGSATVSTSGGTGAYTYTWSPGNLSGTSQTGLAAGTYTIAIKDANSCPGTGTLTITQPTTAIAASISATTTTGCGASTGGATVTASGGTPTYSYSWTPSGGTTAGVSNLAAGNNTVLVTDIKGCTVTAVAIISSASGPTLSVASQTNVNCFGANTGTASVNVSGGTGPYSYTWTPGNLSGASQTTLGAGAYTINVKDVSNCLGTTTLTITQPTAAVSAVISATTTAGCGVSTGGATVTPGGGTPGYSYSWTPSGGTTAGVSNLAAGNNTVTITDIKGCTVTAVANITASGGPTLSVVSQASVSCFGASTGTATINASGGTGPYTYTWTPGNLNGASQTTLAAGTYTVNVKDINLCASSITLTIAQPTSSVNAAISATTTTGCGASTGGATVTPGGGTPGYSYSWTPSGGTTAGVSNLASGNNSVTVMDANGCTVTVVANITTAGGPTLSVVSQASVNCFGTSTGSATVNGSGGTGPYTYTWSPGNLSSVSQTGLSAGTYTVNIMDINLCAGSGTLVIAQPTAALSAIISATTVTGCGSSTGGATVTPGGGTPTYSYSWAPSGGTTIGVSNLGAGANTVTITDVNGCTVTAVANITTAGGPTLSVASQTNVNCFGANTGSATINASGGVSPITYTWTPGNLSGASQTALSAGTYTINALDANSCASSITVSISQPTASLSGVISNTTAAGCGLSNGSASITASGGTPTYSYSWSPNGGTTPSVSNLSSGNSTVVITDSKGCTVPVVISLSSVSGPTLSVVSQASVNCFGGNTGTAAVNASGGTGPYTYTWSPGNLTGVSQTSLSAGIYTVTVKDANQCTGTGTISITQPTAGITGTITTTPTGCGTSVGSATVTANGGVPAYTYTWGPTAGSGTSISGLAVGNYSVIVADTKGCTVTLNTAINTSGTGPALSVSSQTNAQCFSSTNAGASVSATGTGPFSYSWTPVGGNAASATGLTGGTYTVFVSDASLCVSTITINITQPPAIVVTVTNTSASCGNYDGSATVIASGGTGSLTPLWSVNSNSTTVNGLSAATYSVLVTDATGCTGSAITNVNSVGTLTVNVASNATIHPGESTPLTAFIPTGANVVWSPTTGLSCSTCSITAASPTVTTQYCAYTYIGSCADTSCVLITVDIDCLSATDYSAPNAFSPNGDGTNDEFCLQGWSKCVTSFYIGIYNRWGEKVYDSDDVTFCWDGKFMGNPLNSAVFVYYIKATVKDVGDIVRKGNVTLVK